MNVTKTIKAVVFMVVKMHTVIGLRHYVVVDQCQFTRTYCHILDRKQ